MGAVPSITGHPRWAGLAGTGFGWPRWWPPECGQRTRVVVSLGVAVLMHLLLLLPYGPSPSAKPPPHTPIPEKFVRLSRPDVRPLSRRAPSRAMERPLVRSRRSVSRLAASGPSPGVSSNRGQVVPQPVFRLSTSPLRLAGLQLPVPVSTLVPSPGAGTGRIGSVRKGGRSVDLSSELMDVRGMDTGRHRAIVVVDPHSRRGLKGRLSLARVRSEGLDEAELETAYPRRGTGVHRSVAEAQALEGLALRMSKETRVHTKVAGAVSLDDHGRLGLPFLLITANDPFELTAAEINGLGRYLTGGGFVYAESVSYPRAGGAGRTTDIISLRELIRDAMRTAGLQEGDGWQFRRMAPDHPVYHCFYDLPALPMGFWDTTENSYMNRGEDMVWSPDYLEAIEVGDEVVGIYSQKDYCDYWGGMEDVMRERGWSGRFAARMGLGGEGLSVERLGVNVLVYALTREGSVARKVVAE